MKGDYNLNASNKITFRYNQLKSSTDVSVSGSSSLGFGRQTFSTNFLGFQNSNYSILENIHSGIGEWNSVVGSSMSNNLIVGYTKQDESRGQLDTLFPFVDILDGGNTYTSFGSEPFTPANLLLYDTFQAQDSFTKYGTHHSLTFGGAVEKYHSDNSFYPGIQSAYVYNSLDDFYADANDYLANPGRMMSPVALNKFQVRYSNVPGSVNPPFQPLDVWYTSLYAQDEWRPRTNLTVTGGVRMDVAKFGATGFDNPAVDALTFRDRDGSAVQYDTGALPKTTPLWSPRVGFNWDVNADQRLQVRGGTGVFTGKPAYVWISNQIGNTGILTGFIQSTGTTAFPFNPNPDAYKPEATGQPPSSAAVAVTDPDFKFPQVWRTNIAVDKRLPWGLVGTGEYIYNHDVNGMAYINANLPAAQSAYAGPDSRPLWTGNRINNTPGNQVVENYVLLNQSIGRSWTASASVTKPMTRGLTFKAAYRYGRARNSVDPGSIASGSWTNNPIVVDPNNPALGYAATSPGHRFFLATSYTHDYFHFGATTVAAFFDAYTNGNTSYIFSGDMNKDGGSSNDLIYIPRDSSEMNFTTFTSGGEDVHGGRPGLGLRGLHPAGRLPAHPPWPVRRAERRLPADGEATGLQHHAGGLPHTRRGAPLGRDPARHHQLREPAEPRLGREPERDPEPDPEQPRHRRAGTGHLPPGHGEHLVRPAADLEVVPDQRGHQRRVRDDAQLPLHVPVRAVGVRPC